MRKKYTINEIEEQARKIHGDKYEYDFSTYRRKSLKMRMICHKKDKNGNEHGEFWQSMENHTKKNPCGCPKCAIEELSDKKRLTVDKINERLKKINEGRYFLPEETEYYSNTQKLRFICKKHGEFEAYVCNILKGENCPCCRSEKMSETLSLGIDEFKRRLKIVHGTNIETLEDSKYINNSTLIKLYCHEKDKNGNEHGVFWGMPFNILTGGGCKKCKQKKLSMFHTKTFDSFLKDVKEIHGDKYKYDEKSYVDTHTNMRIFCPCKDENGNEHGWFLQTPHSHLIGHGCPICSENKMEREIRNFLEKENINKKTEHTFEWLKHKSFLYLDFYLPDYNIAIECQGKQHFEKIEWFDKDDNFEIRQIRDKIKYDLCKEHGIKIFYYSKLKKYDNFLGERVFHNKKELLDEIIKTRTNKMILRNYKKV